MKDRDQPSPERKEPAAYPASTVLRDFSAFVETLPNRDARLSEMTPPKVRQAVSPLPLDHALWVIHTIGPQMASAQKCDDGGSKGGSAPRHDKDGNLLNVTDAMKRAWAVTWRTRISNRYKSKLQHAMEVTGKSASRAPSYIREGLELIQRGLANDLWPKSKAGRPAKLK